MGTDRAGQLDLFDVAKGGNPETTAPIDETRSAEFSWTAYLAARLESCRENRRRLERAAVGWADDRGNETKGGAGDHS